MVSSQARGALSSERVSIDRYELVSVDKLVHLEQPEGGPLNLIGSAFVGT